jgi:hypothetical protein
MAALLLLALLELDMAAAVVAVAAALEFLPLAALALLESSLLRSSYNESYNEALGFN